MDVGSGRRQGLHFVFERLEAHAKRFRAGLGFSGEPVRACREHQKEKHQRKREDCEHRCSVDEKPRSHARKLLDIRFPRLRDVACGCASINLFAKPGDPARISIGHFCDSYSVRRIAPAKASGSAARKAASSATPVSTGRNRCDRAHGSGSRRSRSARACGTSARTPPAGRDAGQLEPIHRVGECSPTIHGAPTSSNGRVVPRPSDTFVPSNSTVPG